MGEGYLETQSTAFNPTSAAVGSTGTGAVSIPVQSGQSQAQASTGANASVNRGAASSLSASLLYTAGPALALAALISRLA